MLSRMISNKKIWYIPCVIVAAVMIVAVGMLIFVDSGNRSVSAKSSTEAVKVKSVKIDDSTKHASQLYGAKVEDINDTAKVEELFEVMGLEDVTGEYTVEISQEDETMVLALNITDPVQKSSKKVFNRNVRKYAQQMLVLIPQIDRVQWTYHVISSNSQNASGTSDTSSEEAVVTAVDHEKFESTFGKAPKSFAKSTDTVKKLLEKQAGK